MSGQSAWGWSLVRDLAVLATGEAVTRAATFIAFVHLARVLGPAEFGLVEVTLAVMMLLTRVAGLGLGEVGTREVARHPDTARGVVGRVVSAQLTVAVAVYGLLAAVVLGLVRGPLSTLLLGYGVTLVGGPFLLLWVFQGRGEMSLVAVLQGLRWSTFATLALLLVRAPGQVARLPPAEILAVALTGTVALLFLRRCEGRLGVSFFRYDRRLLREGAPIGASQVLWALRMYLPIVILGGLAGDVAVGLFGTAHRVFMVSQAILGVYLTSVFPRLSRLSGKALSEFLERSVHVAVWPSLALAAVVTLAAPTIIDVVFGAQYAHQASPAVLAVLIWVLPLLACREQMRSALIAIGRQDDEALCSVLGLTVLLVLAVPLCRAQGAVGVARAMVISEMLAAVLVWWRLSRHVPQLGVSRLPRGG